MHLKENICVRCNIQICLTPYKHTEAFKGI
jgi:hypothetical protein